jgi:hypothetical protein
MMKLGPSAKAKSMYKALNKTLQLMAAEAVAEDLMMA